MKQKKRRFKTKYLNNTIMKHSRLSNNFLSHRTEMPQYQITRHFDRLLNLCSQIKLKLTIKLVQNKITDDKIEIANLFNKYFVNIAKKLGLFTKDKSAVFLENSLNKV